jgi:hypothetical protein
MTRSRNADRFYFENPDAGFTAEEIQQLKNTTLREIIALNTGGTVLSSYTHTHTHTHTHSLSVS